MLTSRQLVLLFALLIANFSHIHTVQAQVADRDMRVQSTKQVDRLPISIKRWALIIGVDQYKDKQISSLFGATNDAKLLADALIKHAGFPSDQVIVLATDQPEERQPTRVNILRRLSNLKSVVPKDGLLLIAFAGHGIERDGKAFLLPSDAQISEDITFLEDTALSVARIKERIRATEVQQVVILLDACRSNPVGRTDTPNVLTESYTRGFNFDVANKEVIAFATLYAASVGERAYEYTEKRQGYFTWAVIEGLKGGAANDKGEITLASLLKFIQETVPKRIGIDLGANEVQRPFAMIEGYKAENLVLAIDGRRQLAQRGYPPPQGGPVQLSFRTATAAVIRGMDLYTAIIVNGEAEISAADIYLKYDPKIFEVKAVRDGGLLRAGGVKSELHFQADNGLLEIQLRRPEGAGGAIARGQLLLIVFMTNKAGGKSLFKLDEQRTVLRSPSGNSVPISFIPRETQVEVFRGVRR